MPDSNEAPSSNRSEKAAFASRVIRHLDGLADDAEVDELTQELSSDVEKRRQYIHLCRQSWSIREYVHLNDNADLSPIMRIGRRLPASIQEFRNLLQRRSGMWSLALAATIVMSVSVVAAIVSFSGPGGPRVATLASSIDATWGGRSPDAGGAIYEGRYELADGSALIEFDSGAQLVVESGTQIEFQSESRVELHAGSVVVRCETPESKGFVVAVPEGEVIDLGTEFGVFVSDESGEEAEIHVLDGSVRFDPEDGSAGVELLAGDALRVDSNATRLPVQLSGASFTRVADYLNVQARPIEAVALHGVLDDQELGSVLLWASMSTADGGNSIPNHAGDSTQALRAYSQLSRRQVPGVSGSDALQFNTSSDRLDFEVGGSYDELTLMAWVRFDQEGGTGLRRRALLMSEGWNRPGQIHWQAKRNWISFGIYDDRPTVSNNSTSRSFENWDIVDGGWHHLAVTVRVTKTGGTVAHYVDGSLISEQNLPSGTPRLRIDSASIGAWRNDRAINGAIDDIVILSRTLSATEVREYMKVDP